MTEASSWRDVKAEARAVDPSWGTQERVERRAAYRSQMLAAVIGSHAYVAGLGGHLDIVARIGNIQLDVA